MAEQYIKVTKSKRPKELLCTDVEHWIPPRPITLKINIDIPPLMEIMPSLESYTKITGDCYTRKN